MAASRGAGWLAPPLALAAAATEAANGVQAIRRLHDRGRTGWWLALYEAVYALSLFGEWADRAAPHLAGALGLLAVAFVAWFCLELFGRPGTPGPNRHGAPPA